MQFMCGLYYDTWIRGIQSLRQWSQVDWKMVGQGDLHIWLTPYTLWVKSSPLAQYTIFRPCATSSSSTAIEDHPRITVTCARNDVCVCVCVCGPGFTVASKSYYDRFTERRVVIERLLMDIKDWKLQDCMQRANTDVQLFVGRTETSFFWAPCDWRYLVKENK